MLHLTEDDVRRLLSMSDCIRLMDQTFRSLAEGTAINQPRRRLILPTGSVLHQMAGSIGKYFGTKIYSVNLKHGANFFFHLFDAATAKPLALMEANFLGQIRTGAASGFATSLLARPDAATLAVIGSGFQAQSQIEAIREVRVLKEIRVWSRNPERRKVFAEKMQARATDTAEDAVRGADIVVTATHSKDPVLEADWIAPGSHINAMGSNQAQRRELPSDLIAKANLIAVDSIEQSKIEAGDLLLAWEEKDWQTPRLIELKDAFVIHRSPNDITIFKSNGLGVEDVAAGGFVYEQALAERGIQHR